MSLYTERTAPSPGGGKKHNPLWLLLVLSMQTIQRPRIDVPHAHCVLVHPRPVRLSPVDTEGVGPQRVQYGVPCRTTSWLRKEFFIQPRILQTHAVLPV